VGLAAAAPLLFSLVSFAKRGSFEPAEDLQNAAERRANFPSNISKGSQSRRKPTPAAINRLERGDGEPRVCLCSRWYRGG